MLSQENSKIRGGILDDECGLNKTIQALCLIAFAATQASEPHYLMLILTSFQIVDIWIAKINNLFSDVLNLIVYYEIMRPKDSTDPIQKQYTVNP